MYTEGTRALYRLFFVSDSLAPLGESFLFLLVLAAPFCAAAPSLCGGS